MANTHLKPSHPNRDIPACPVRSVRKSRTFPELPMVNIYESKSDPEWDFPRCPARDIPTHPARDNPTDPTWSLGKSRTLTELPRMGQLGPSPPNPKLTHPNPYRSRHVWCDRPPFTKTQLNINTCIACNICASSIQTIIMVMYLQDGVHHSSSSQLHQHDTENIRALFVDRDLRAAWCLRWSRRLHLGAPAQALGRGGRRWSCRRRWPTLLPWWPLRTHVPVPRARQPARYQARGLGPRRLPVKEERFCQRPQEYVT